MLKIKTAVLLAGRVDAVEAGDVVVVVVVDVIVVDVVVVDEVINPIVDVVVDVFDNELRLVIGMD